jgi:EAL domain-containing protein (putative c-di-GMP-specific phosphodiesterase class I)
MKMKMKMKILKRDQKQIYWRKTMAQPAISISNIMNKRLFFHEYQPLWRTKTKEVFAYEALIRTVHGINPVSIFQYGREQGTLYDFDIASITNAIKSYPDSYFEKHLLFVNIFPSTLVNPEFLKYKKIS